jgi:hypothetical protein
MMTRLRVLLVEDSEEDAELIRIDLAKAGFDLDWARVETEDEFVASLDEMWDLIISDYSMPEFDGLRAFALFKERQVDIPFIFVSGALGEERAVEAMRAGARDYVLKGNLKRLGVAVRRELAEAKNRAAQRRAQEAARREQRRLAMAVDASGSGVFEHSVPVGPDTYLSARCEEILGSEQEEPPTREGFLEWFFEQFHPEDSPVVQTAYVHFLEGMSTDLSVEGRVRHGDADWIDVAIFGKAVERTADGRACRVVGVMLDMTDRRRLEEQLRQAQKMEAVGRLAGGVAHDFNNLLTAIFSFGNFVLDELEEGDAVREDMDEVIKAARKAETLTGQLLAFSRRRPISPKVTNLNTLITEMDRMLRRVVGEDVELVTELLPDLWNVRVDPGTFEQVIVNLVVNAKDAMPDGGRITLETANVTLDDDYGQAQGGVDVPPGEYVLFVVADDGAGMDEETRRMVFEPFFTTKGPGKGTGLGLSTCYGIVKQAGGFIWVSSALGNGTTFEIHLPRVLDEEDRRSVPRSVVNVRGTETILVAEDDEQVRRLVVRALTRLGYEVLQAPTGAEAVGVCARAAGEIHLLLTDVVMPEMSGKQLADEVMKLQPGTKVLYMSGYTSNAIVHRGVLEPGTRLLQKPFTPDVLARKVRSVLDD